MAIIKTYCIEDLDHKIDPLWWQEKGLAYTGPGHGKRIPTLYKVRLPDNNRWRRVYCCISKEGNICYVEHGKDWIVVGQ